MASQQGKPTSLISLWQKSTAGLKVLSLTPLLLLTFPVMASSWQAGYENGLWEASEPSRLRCELNHYIPDFGVARFIHRSGERVRMEVDVFRHAMNEGQVQLVALAPQWQPGQGTQDLGNYRIETTDYPLRIANPQTELVLEALRQGRLPSLIQTVDDDRVERRRASLTPVRFHQAFADFQQCQASLLPVNFDQIEEVMINFDLAKDELGEADYEILDLIVRYVNADPEVVTVKVDGHTDSLGSRTRNREISHERAQQVTEYLVARGMPAEMITTEFHGQRYPIADNRTEAGRAKNRRVMVTLEPAQEIKPLF
ncbi:OmpA family protein [Marinospirillum perlucidum]|uniref:MotY family protein n=1 Tax=Marinospirillum perlucidum TaxID=1982602 RepID=UPI000DF185E6|nr:OmpA family protein [Marinospirillum perlucidum]